MWQTSNCSLLLIYRPQKDERLSWPGWLTYSGRFTHMVIRQLQVERRTGNVRRSETNQGLREKFNDTKHRAVSPRQLSFLLYELCKENMSDISQKA